MINNAQSYYPISIDKIEEKVERKIKRATSRKENDIYELNLFNPYKDFPNIQEMVNEHGETIMRIDGDIPPNLPIENNDRFLFISYDQTAFTHGLHKYPAKFFPELPRWLIQRYSKEGDLILDPFTGSGTTNVEALLNNRHSVGIDVDPFSRYISKVKTTPLDEKSLYKTQKYLLDQIVKYHPKKIMPEDIPDFPYRDNWFNEEIIYELAYIKKTILNMDTTKDIKDFYLVCFSSIIRSVSNADDNCTRTVIRKKLNKQVYPSFALVKFAETILISVPKMVEFSNRVSSSISVEIPHDMDARHIDYNPDIFDLAVTSPPYVNAVDYPRTHQLELYWLEFESGSLVPLKKKHIGTENVPAKLYNELHSISIKEADIVIEKIYKQDPKRAYIAYKYLADMEKNLKEVYKVLKPGSHYVIVVGNNRIRGQLFESWKYLIALAERVGFTLEKYFASEIIRHFIKVPREERIDTDWIIVLKK